MGNSLQMQINDFSPSVSCFLFPAPGIEIVRNQIEIAVC